jgi:outer membrane lipoprotein SlyB
MPENSSTSSAPTNALRNAYLVGGGVGLIGLGLAAGMYLRTAPASEPVDPVVAQAASAAQASSDAVADAKVEQAAIAARKHVARHAASNERRSTSGIDSQDAPRTSVVCATCGVILSVSTIEQQGQGTGLGAVTGGVLGGVVGNQMGKGQGNAAMTVLGAIGGGLAGNEVEKRQRTVTAFEVRVRMDDGRVRTFMQQTAPAVGARVETAGETFQVVRDTRN